MIWNRSTDEWEQRSIRRRKGVRVGGRTLILSAANLLRPNGASSVQNAISQLLIGYWGSEEMLRRMGKREHRGNEGKEEARTNTLGEGDTAAVKHVTRF